MYLFHDMYDCSHFTCCICSTDASMGASSLCLTPWNTNTYYTHWTCDTFGLMSTYLIIYIFLDTYVTLLWLSFEMQWAHWHMPFFHLNGERLKLLGEFSMVYIKFISRPILKKDKCAIESFVGGGEEKACLVYWYEFVVMIIQCSVKMLRMLV